METTLYHGSRMCFAKFDEKFIGKTNSVSFGRGFYFTPNKEKALKYCRNDGYLYECVVDLKKPLSQKKITLSDTELYEIFFVFETRISITQEYIEKVKEYLETDIGIFSMLQEETGKIGKFYSKIGYNYSVVEDPNEVDASYIILNCEDIMIRNITYVKI